MSLNVREEMKFGASVSAIQRSTETFVETATGLYRARAECTQNCSATSQIYAVPAEYGHGASRLAGTTPYIR